MGIIRKLSDTVANKIAAGEVIERPASVVKELVENAIDAEASMVEIEIEDGGKRLIKVTDNGVGMLPEDLAMAVQSHATSKLVDSDDLFFITTLGFRGEAVPSIGAVSEMRITSRPRNATAGAEIRMTGGKITEPKAAGTPEGTTFEISNLFFNIPARRKFLKTTSTELSHIVDTVTKMALAYPKVGFKLLHNNREVFHCLEGESRLRRITHFLGKELQSDLLEVNSGDGPLTFNGFIGPPSQTRSNTKLQYVFLNGRFIRDKTIASAIRDAYFGLIPGGRQPIVILFLQIDPREVDVNVHPTKHEVRFRNSQMIYLAVRKNIQQKLQSAAAPEIELRRELSAQFDEALDGPRRPGARSAHRADPARSYPPTPPSQWNQKVRRDPLLFESPAIARPPHSSGTPPWSRKQTSAPAEGQHYSAQPRQSRGVQIHESYLVEETDDGLRIVDQHALHERILYDRIKKRIEETGLESQRLLVPVTIELTNDEVILLTGASHEMKALGLEVEEFGKNTVALHTVPTLLRGFQPEEVLHDLIAHLQEDRDGDKKVEPRESLMKMIACKAAVKANQRLTPAEVASLLEKAKSLPAGITCPHGRPTTLTLSLEELEKHFLRK